MQVRDTFHVLRLLGETSVGLKFAEVVDAADVEEWMDWLL